MSADFASFTPLPTLAAIAADLAAGRTSAQALVESALARIAAPDGQGAATFTLVMEKTARAAAQASDALRAAGLVRSPLEGIPVSVKDVFDVAGHPTTAGTAALRQAQPAQANAAIVEQLHAAGAIVVGRTNMTQLAFSGLGVNPELGTPLNPWDRCSARIAGGSSSGAAVSVTDGMAAAAIGTDTGGSVRIPAALCGLVGFKPTAARVSMAGMLHLAEDLDSVGFIAASVACCARLDAVLAAPAAQPRPKTAFSVLGDQACGGGFGDLAASQTWEIPSYAPRFALVRRILCDGLDAHVSDNFNAALQALREAGAQIVEIDCPELAEPAAVFERHGTLAAARLWHAFGPAVERGALRFDPRVVSRMRRGQTMSAADFIALQHFRAEWAARFWARLAGFDAMLAPTVPTIAPTVAELQDEAAYFAANARMLRNPSFINFANGCSLSLPCQAAGSAPVGLMLSAAPMHDAQVLRWAGWVERVLASRRA